MLHNTLLTDISHFNSQQGNPLLHYTTPNSAWKEIRACGILHQPGRVGYAHRPSAHKTHITAAVGGGVGAKR